MAHVASLEWGEQRLLQFGQVNEHGVVEKIEGEIMGFYVFPFLVSDHLVSYRASRFFRNTLQTHI
jgi:hypothetical protein